MPRLVMKFITVGRVEQYKYVGTVVDNKLTFDRNLDTFPKNVTP